MADETERQASEAAAAPVHDMADIFADDHFAHRGAIADVDGVPMQQLIARLSATPGRIHRLTVADLKQISPTQHSASAHDTSLATALEMGERMGLALPSEFIIYAIEVENIIDFGEEPTPAVAAAIPQVTAAVLAELA